MRSETHTNGANGPDRNAIPAWLPDAARQYLLHVEAGQSLRAIARAEKVHASTVLRHVRKYEQRRDDPLIDGAFDRIGQAIGASPIPQTQFSGDSCTMTIPLRPRETQSPDGENLREARRVLRRLQEPGACLAVAPDMDKAVVVRETPDGRTVRTAVLDAKVAESMAVQDWIEAFGSGRVQRYRISATGRAALRRILAEEESARAGFSEAPARFGDQHRMMTDREGDTRGERQRFNMAESPVAALARRRDKDGEVFLTDDLVLAAERLREDFELAQMGPRVAQNWERFLTVGDRGQFRPDAGQSGGSEGARTRVAADLRDLGPGLGDVALRCCCFLEGLETAERRMGWSARSGKIVLRIALQRLRRHYEDSGALYGMMIG